MSRIFVTGASSGLGLLTATSLADSGHDVVLHIRNPQRLEETSIPAGAAGTIYGDLADLDATVDVAAQADRLGPFDTVIHNAGTMTASHTLAVNTVAPYVLSGLMERPARIIVLSSSMHLSGSPRVGSGLDSEAVSYADSKLYVTALTFALARRWPEILVHAVDPGWVPTRMGGRTPPDDLEQGYRTQAWLATAAETAIVPRTGGYWHHRSPRRAHPAAYDPSFQDELLSALAQLTGILLPMS